MIRGLVGKELRQHGSIFALLFVLVLGALFLILGNEGIELASGGGFAGVRLAHFTFIPLASLMLAQMLIASEFRQKTQIFLEGLPLPRWRMLAVKFALGLTVLMTSLVGMLALAWWYARGSEALTARFLAILILKSAGWGWFVYTLCFAHGFLGRYRFIFATIIFTALATMLNLGVKLSAFGPFALVDDRFPYERYVIPTHDLWVTGLLGFGMMLIGFALGHIRDATLATMLVEKMSAREKLFATLLCIIGLGVIASIEQQREDSTPVQMPGAIDVRQGVVHVSLASTGSSPTEGEVAALHAVGQRVASSLERLVAYLGCTSFPPVFLVHRPDLAPGEIANGELKPAQGVLLRANLLHEEFDELKLLRKAVRLGLNAHRGGFATRERNAWVLDGLPAWWNARDGPPESWTEARKRARDAMPKDFSGRDLRRWYTIRKSAEQSAAEDLAATGLAVLSSKYGEEPCRAFLRSAFSQARPADVRGWLQDVSRPLHRKLRSATGASEAEFVRQWRQSLLEEDRN